MAEIVSELRVPLKAVSGKRERLVEASRTTQAPAENPHTVRPTRSQLTTDDHSALAKFGLQILTTHPSPTCERRASSLFRVFSVLGSGVLNRYYTRSSDLAYSVCVHCALRARCVLCTPTRSTQRDRGLLMGLLGAASKHLLFVPSISQPKRWGSPDPRCCLCSQEHPQPLRRWNVA